MKEINIMVKGMMCEKCENVIKKALNNIEGINSVYASHQNNLVKVTCDNQISQKMIEEIIINLGYEIVNK